VRISPPLFPTPGGYDRFMNESFLRQVKVLVGDPTKAPALHDLVAAEVARVVEAIRDESFASGPPYSKEDLARRATAYEELAEDLGRAAAVVAYWSQTTDERIVPRAIARLANAPDRSAGTGTWLDLALYPAVLVLYSAGLGAVIGRREMLLAQLLTQATIRQRDDWKPAALALHAPAAIEHRVAQQLPGLDRRHTPVSDHLVEVLRPWLEELEPDQGSYEWAFDRFEYLFGLIAYDISRQERSAGWGAVGRFSWRGQYGNGIEVPVEAEIASLGDQWPLLRAGLFGRDLARLRESVTGWHQRIGSVRNQQH
jgi:hypothetical protein